MPIKREQNRKLVTTRKPEPPNLV